MYTPEAKFRWQCIRVIGLALLSLILPVLAIWPVTVTTAPFPSQTSQSDYHPMVASLVLAIACAVGAFAQRAPGMRGLLPTSARWLSMVLATLGLLLSMYVLWTVIGTCGAGVIVGRCIP